MHRAVLLLICACVLSSAGAQVTHVHQQIEALSLPVSRSVMDERIAAAAARYAQAAPIARYAQYDYAAPRDPREYTALQGYGVVLVSVLAQAGEELPPKRVVARVGARIVPLVLYASGSASVTQPQIRAVFGAYRWEGLYVLPLELVAGGAELAIDFAVNRNDFVLARFGERELAGLAGMPVALPLAPAPPAAAFDQFLSREYPGYSARR